MRPITSGKHTLMLIKSYAEACERNQGPILEQLRELFDQSRLVLEIGSGTGQHAVYFARALPTLTWQPSDLIDRHSSIRAWREEAALPNLNEPVLLDVGQSRWPGINFDAVFSANTLHIMSLPEVEKMLAGIGARLPSGGIFAVYGPFNYGGQYTSDSNRQFDAWLKSRDPLSGIRDFEVINALAQQQGLRLLRDVALPANNRLLAWTKD
jgi:SAM-dependent methyltransferase